jgi:subtilisin family serine protease
MSACPSSLPAVKCTPSNNPGWSYKSGTSMATPFVSAAAALLAAACPASPRNAGWVQFVQDRLKGTAGPIADQTLPNADYGAGTLRADRAVTGVPCPGAS